MATLSFLTAVLLIKTKIHVYVIQKFLASAFFANSLAEIFSDFNTDENRVISGPGIFDLRRAL